MARRRRNNDNGLAEIAGVVGVLAVLAVAHPPTRQKIFDLFILVLIIGIAVIFFLCVWASMRRKDQGAEGLRSQEAVLPVTMPVPPVQNVPNPFGTQPTLIEQIRSLDWFQFEKVVEVVYRKLGYTVTRRGGANADGGIDLVIEKLGVKEAIQCKHWKTWNVGVKAMREFLGALTDAGIGRGIFITLGGYTGDARQLAAKHAIEIINETDFAALLERADARFDPEVIAALTDSRKFCPKCESEMVLRTARKGIGAGGRFWGCSRYPACRFTMQV